MRFLLCLNSRTELMESKDETNCQTREGPILCVNNCGFFGSAATMNMCSKCHKEMISQQEQTKLAMSSIENIANGGFFANNPVVTTSVAPPVPVQVDLTLAVPTEVPECSGGVPPKEGPKRCTTCQKRLGLTGFTCRCGNLFCSSHRYSDKHDCQFDYQKAGRDAIARANPVVKSDKLDKI